MMHALTQPEFFVPLHGEYKHLCAHASLAREMGMKSKNIMIPENGKIIEVGKRGLASGGTVPAEQILVDGYGVGDVGATVLKDRLHLAEDGIIVVSATVDFTILEMTAGPEIITRGFVYAKENERLMEELVDKSAELIRKFIYNGKPDMYTLKERVKTSLSSFIYSKTKKKPIVLPVFTENELY